ncbi:MAG: Uma2 family endonuclease [Polyangiales bacterium]
MPSRDTSPSLTDSGLPLHPSNLWTLRDAVMPPSADASSTLARDWSQWYLTDEEDMGEGFEQGEIIRMLISCIEELGRERGWQDWLCAGDQFFAWMREEPLVRISPDVYILDHPPLPPEPASWQTWMPGQHAPSFAVEVVSEDWHKDYVVGPQKYAALGCPELVIFDPEAVRGPVTSSRVPLQVWRRARAQATLRLVHAGLGPYHAQRLDAWLVPVHQGGRTRLRLAYDAQGELWVPTSQEARAQEAEARMQAEQARAQEAEARMQAEQARAQEAEARMQAEQEQREAARAKREMEARVRELEALLAARSGSSD